MVTFVQCSKKKMRKKRFLKKRRLALKKCPQKRGTCVYVKFLNPKKPCSARRAVTWVKLSSYKHIMCHIPGETHNLRKFSNVLVRGGRASDLPGIKYRIIRSSSQKYDLLPLYKRRKARSKYGTRDSQRKHRIRATRGKGTSIYYHN